MAKPVFFGIFLGISIILSLSTAALHNYGSCITPNGENAVCTVLDECEYLFNILKSPTLSNVDKLYLRRSQCGYTNNTVLICCPDRYQEVSTHPTPVQIETEQLLPQPGQCGNVLSNRIYGGNITKIDEYPWTALIEYTKPYGTTGHHCGGSLINKRYVITASHCVNGKGLPTDWRLSGVRLGEWDITTNPDCEMDVRGMPDCAPAHLDVPVEIAIPHPHYNPDSKHQHNDIALLRLVRNIEYTDFVRPICLPIDANLRTATFEGIVMDVAGWGKTEKSSSSAVKLKASVEGVELSECKKVYSNQDINVEDTQMCAGGAQGVDSCRGDSGGPLISMDTTSKVRYYYFIAGIVSYGPTPCGLAGWPGVYTRVGHFVEWIEDTIRP